MFENAAISLKIQQPATRLIALVDVVVCTFPEITTCHLFPAQPRESPQAGGEEDQPTPGDQCRVPLSPLMLRVGNP